MAPAGKRTAPVTTVATREVYASPWWKVEEHDVVNVNEKAETFNVLRCEDGVSVLAIDGRHAFLIREYKYAVGHHMLQLPSGSIDAGESPLRAARRELQEEAGLTATAWRDLGVVHPYPTNVVDKVHLFVAEGVCEVQSPEPGVERLRLKVSEIRALIERNEITHAASLVCLLRYLQAEAT